jgi:hypothetical protein
MLITTCRLMFANQAQFDSAPAGTEYMILCNDLHGDKVIAVKPKVNIMPLLLIGWRDIPEGTTYDNGAALFILGDTPLNWEIKVITDPCAEYTNAQILFSASLRGII